MPAIATVVNAVWSVRLSVTLTHPAKVQLPFGKDTRVAPSTSVF